MRPGASTTGSTTGRPPSARSSVERGDPAGQLGQRVNPQRRDRSASGSSRRDRRPRASADQRRPQPQPGGGHDVVVEPVTDIQGLIRADRGYFDIVRKNPGSGLPTPQSSEVAIMSAGRSRARRMLPARAVWFPAIPTHRPSSRSRFSAAAHRDTGRPRRTTRVFPHQPAAAGPCPGRNPAGRPGRSPGSPGPAQ